MSDGHVAGVVVFTFETTHQALWAEDVAREREIPVETAPAPPEAKAKCGIAIRAPSALADELSAAFRDEGIEFDRMMEPAAEDPAPRDPTPQDPTRR